jgi:undecaprenyl-diphosphatase
MDYEISHSLDRFSAHHDAFEDVLGGYVSASEALFIAAIVLLFLWIGSRWRATARYAAVSAAASAGLALLIAHFLGGAVDRARPFVAHPGAIHDFLSHSADASFPSDHATASFAIAVAVWLRNRLWGTVLLILAAILSLGRVFLGVHYLSDVLAGAALGTLVAVGLFRSPLRRLLDGLADRAGWVLDDTLTRVKRRIA